MSKQHPKTTTQLAAHLRKLDAKMDEKYPEGRLGREDRGAVHIGLGVDSEKKVIRMIFGHPITWLGLSPDSAEAVGMSLIRMAEDLRKGGPPPAAGPEKKLERGGKP